LHHLRTGDVEGSMYNSPLNQLPNQPTHVQAGPPTSGHLPHAASPYAPPSSPYAPPSFDYQPVESAFNDGGSYGLGICAGFVFGLIGLLIVYFTGKSETKRGALHGFLGALVLNLGLLLIS
jgi:hypothetical protein